MTVEQPQPVDAQVADLARHCGALQSVLRQLAEGGAEGDARQGLLTTGALGLLDIKGAHRAVFEAGEAARATTADAKQGLESLSLQLANLRYQQRHHESDIAACLDARSAYNEADISLLPEADFLSTAGKQWTAALPGGDEHALMVARLKHEAAMRQALLSDLQKTRARKDGLAAAAAQKRRFADGLASELASLRESAAPLRASLQVTPPGIALPEGADSLPLPLYIAATQLLAAQASFDTPLEVSVVQRQPQKQAAAAAEMPDAATGTQPAGDAATPATVGSEAADTEMAEAAEGDEEEGEATLEENDATPPQEEDATAEAPLEPLAVELILGQRSARLLTIMLAYSTPQHKVYTSGADADENRALAATDGAGGKDAKPKAAAALQGPRPYKWAQQLGGVDFLLPPPADGPFQTAAGADGHVLAGLADYRQGQRALKVLEALRGAQRSTAVAAKA